MSISSSEGIIFEAWDVRSVELTATSNPSFAEIVLRRDGGTAWLRLTNPNPLNAVGIVFDICHGIRVVDRNSSESNQLEYGRYRLSVYDDYDKCGHFLAERIEIVEE